MGLFQKAIETYDHMESIAGKEIAGRATLAPVGFISTKVQLAITLKQNGEFAGAERIFSEKTASNGKTVKEDRQIIIPVTESSLGRTISAATTPHPLCDKLMFLCPDHPESYAAYIAQLEEWCGSEYSVSELAAVLKYVKSGTIRSDLSALSGIKDDDFVCWRVRSFDCEKPDDIWQNEDVIASYISFCRRRSEEKSEKALCYVTGEYLPAAKQHLKGVVAYSGNAKLISANDTSNYTYRGRFTDDTEALTVSFIASQKAHNALKWIVANDGVRFGDRTLICWNPKGKKIPKTTVSLFSLFGKTLNAEERPEPSNYRELLRRKIEGYKSFFEPEDEAVTAILEAATTGRLSVSYYSEMKAEDFLERLRYWDESTAWLHRQFGVTAPALRDIVNAAYGALRTNENKQTVETDETLMAGVMQRLLLCRLERAPFPDDVLRAAVRKCSALALYDEENGNRQKQLFTSCAIIRKYRFDHFKEDWVMALEPERKNISYQYGRLLAVLEKAEKDTYEQGEKRQTNAIRMQPIFVKRPMYASKIITEQLKNAYYPRLSIGARRYYDRLIGEIYLQISECENWESDKPLTEEYLMGYYLQKNSLYSKKENNESEEK